MNFLEQLAAEWYALQGSFVRSNVKANRRVNGGWDSELDVLAYSPATGELVHVETSAASSSWDVREERARNKKFVYSIVQYAEMIGTHPSMVRKRMVVGSQQVPPEPFWDDIEVVTIPQFMAEIHAGLKGRHPMRDAVPENYPRLRAIQFSLAYSGRA